MEVMTKMDNMKELKEICEMFDSYFIADKQNQLNKKYIASSDIIFSDGKFNHHINTDGYIVIDNIEDANYIIFLDQSGDAYIAIYQYTPAHKFKDITDKNKQLRDSTGIKKHSIIADTIVPDVDLSEKLVDINEFCCPGCGGKMKFLKVKSSNETIVAYCESCKTEYVLIPSKYYVIKAKKQFYNSTNERNITVENNNKKGIK